ncbi:MAG TPA: TetR/AcrR family transcriptional regulator [Natronosporangium sp.]
MSNPRRALLDKVVTFAASEGLADRSLREIAAGVGTSHRMLLHHFGSREGLLAAVVEEIEQRQRDAMAALAAAGDATDLVTGLWERLASPDLRPLVRLFFEVFALASRGVPGTEQLLANLTEPWLAAGEAAATRLGVNADRATLRLGVAVTRGLLLDLLAGSPAEEVAAAHARFVQLLAGSVPAGDRT